MISSNTELEMALIEYVNSLSISEPECWHSKTDELDGFVVCILCGLENREVFYMHTDHATKIPVYVSRKLANFLGRNDLTHCGDAIAQDFKTLLNMNLKPFPNMSVVVSQLCKKNGIAADVEKLKFPKAKRLYNRCKEIFQSLGWEYCDS